jgi:hypothetical protein
MTSVGLPCTRLAIPAAKLCIHPTIAKHEDSLWEKRARTKDFILFFVSLGLIVALKLSLPFLNSDQT